MKHTVILIGFMGAGKTTVGKLLSQKTGTEFLDTDAYVEKMLGKTISQIFAEDGEAYFRERETEALKQILESGKTCVLSCGGGLPLREENRKLLKQIGKVVFLTIRPETVEARLKGDTTRPLLRGDNAGEKIRKLMADRKERYEAAADLMISADCLSPEEICRKIEIFDSLL